MVYSSDGGVTGPDVTQRVDRLAADLGEAPNVVAAGPGRVSPDGSTGILPVRVDEAAERLPATSVERVMDITGDAEGDGLQVELGGYPIEKVERRETGSESVGWLAALVILLVAFGSALAAGLPLVHALRDDVIPEAVAGRGVEASVGARRRRTSTTASRRPAGCRCSSGA